MDAAAQELETTVWKKNDASKRLERQSPSLPVLGEIDLPANHTHYDSDDLECDCIHSSCMTREYQLQKQVDQLEKKELEGFRRETPRSASAPLTPPALPVPVEGELGESVLDGGPSSLFISVVKTAILHLLGKVMQKFQREDCYGCLVDHPSQKQHRCLEVLEDGYYENNFYTLTKRLCGPRFIPAIQHLMEMKQIPANEVKIKTVAETILQELRSVRSINETIDDMYNNLIDQGVFKVSHLRILGDFYEGR